MDTEKAGLKLNIQKTKIVASSGITSWQIEGENTEAVTDFLFLGCKITVDSDCSHEIKRCLLLGRKAMKNLDSILKSSNITLPTKIRVVKAMFFPGVMYGCESWTIKKAEHRRIDALELWCLRRLLSVLDSKEIKPVNPKGRRRQWQATPVLLPRKSHRWRSLADYSPYGFKDMTVTSLYFLLH